MRKIDPILMDDYQMLSRYVVGKSIKTILKCTETHIILLLDDGIRVNFSNLEEELIFDIELPFP